MLTVSSCNRRDFFKQSLGISAALALAGPARFAFAEDKPGAKIKLGLCTYMWGAQWDLPTVIANCEKAEIFGVELRTEHKHGVEPGISAEKRQAVKKRFADSRVTFIGLGTNEAFHYVDRAAVEKAIERSKAFLKLSHELGGSGVKVKPNDLPKGVPQQKTTEQIGHALNELGRFAADLGQQVRLEVHGGCSRLPIIKQILDVADHPSVAICWNSNPTDLMDGGLEANFDLVKKRLGHTTHVHELDDPKYPFRDLYRLLVGVDYAGWTLLECASKVPDGVASMIRMRGIFNEYIAAAQA
jgi:sugar phosphate isomerase/epimerase